VAFGWLLLPLVAVVLVSRTGRLVEAQGLCLAAMLGLVVTVALGGGGTAAAVAWLPIVPFEAAVAARVWLILASGAGALAVAFGLAAASRFLGLGSDLFTHAGYAIPGIIYATGLAAGLQQVTLMRQTLERASSARYRLLAETMGDLVLSLDRFGAVVHASPEAQSLFGISRHDLAGRGLFDRIHVADRPAFLKAVSEAAASEDLAMVTLRLRSSLVAGVRVPSEELGFAWVEARIRRSVDLDFPASENAPVIAILRDVTSRKRHEEELEAARAEAVRANSWKDRFLANVSHELRTPLNAIIGFAEILASEQLAPKERGKQREYADIIRASGGHLLEVVNTILDMSKIESGKFDILPEAFDIVPLIDACCDMVRLKAEQGGIALLRVAPSSLPELVADKRACKQILINLLSNAVKFTPTAGRVTIGARSEGNSIVLYVNDTGIGIMPRDLPHLGDAFFQAQGNHDRCYEGTGLGLSVVRGLVGLHGGSISIESAPGEGTAVSVRLPLDCRKSMQSGGSAQIDAVHRQTFTDRFTVDLHTATVKKIA
jgi:cell cycle sensor histidine kinase DivJ